MTTTAAVASATSAVKTSAGVEAAACMRDAAAAMIELRMMPAEPGMSFPGMVLVEVRMIAPAISPTASETI